MHDARPGRVESGRAAASSPCCGPAADSLQPIDFVLGQGSAAERAAMLQRSAADPILAQELAEVQLLVQRLRGLGAPAPDAERAAAGGRVSGDDAPAASTR